MSRNWIKVAQVANPILLFVAVKMLSDGHRSAAFYFVLSSLAVQLAAANFERHP